MCIAFLGSADIVLHMVLEQMFICLEAGKLGAHEVYDVFFTSKSDCEDARILCISPHRLYGDNGEVSARISSTPGSGAGEDAFYQSDRGIEAKFDPASGEFSLTLPRRRRHAPDTDTTVSHKGIVLKPSIRIPPDIENDPVAIPLLLAGDCGSVIELRLGRILADRCYAFRLMIDPLELVGLPNKYPLDNKEIDGVVSRWGQDAIINCPKTCHNDFREMLATINREQRNYADTIAAVERVVVDNRICLLSARRQQIVLMTPNGVEVASQTPEGCVWLAMKHAITGERTAHEWMAGADEYWRDDVEAIARHLYEYFLQWAKDAPKTKEEASTAIDLRHDNSSLVVNGLAGLGALKENPGARYAAVGKTDKELEDIFHALGTDPNLLTRFYWTGYRIRYSLHFRYLTPEDTDRLDRKRQEEEGLRRISRIGFWLGLAGVALGLLSLLLHVLL